MTQNSIPSNNDSVPLNKNLIEGDRPSETKARPLFLGTRKTLSRLCWASVLFFVFIIIFVITFYSISTSYSVWVALSINIVAFCLTTLLMGLHIIAVDWQNQEYNNVRFILGLLTLIFAFTPA